MAEKVRIAVVQLCVDDRLDHARIRDQVRKQLRSIYLDAERIFLVNEVGGNFGENFRNSVEALRELGAEVVFCAILHHDDCAAERTGRRLPLEQSLADLAAFLSASSLTCPVYAGSIRTSTGEVTW